MVNSRAALGCLIASVVLGIAFHPRVFFGNGSGPVIFSLDGLFFGGQWVAFVLALAALGLSGAAWLGAGESRTVASAWLPLCALLTLTFLAVFGVPHQANSGDWRNGEVGAAAFVRGVARSRKANAKPIELSADAFRGEWRAADGVTFTFSPTGVRWTGSAGSGELALSACGPAFELRYLQRDREVLQDNGLTWSTHAIARYDSTAVDAQIPVAEVACGPADRILFIRASADEIWRWTNALDLDAIKNNTFVLRLNNEKR